MLFQEEPFLKTGGGIPIRDHVLQLGYAQREARCHPILTFMYGEAQKGICPHQHHQID